ncbi:hypothetical protein [uncultured Flavonifractor sp.]|uniref:hypothetical protein n=1 Tax=uncultured Flavonifractor sp. TaxID=1193534 RepID=UPI002626CD8B|nr:hypothetical protein [uncultured Flavonifractor sp.]
MKPILFHTDMVRAILEGRKTVTRRVVKPQPVGQPAQMGEDSCWPGCFASADDERVYRPPYQPGDILWVRETWAHPSKEEIARGTDKNIFLYRADVPSVLYAWDHWNPSIHMPREAARIFLRVTGVRVERLRDVKYFDCLAEGILYRQMETDIVQDFSTLWDTTIKPADRAAYGWGANPWVWVIQFERTKELGP